MPAQCNTDLDSSASRLFGKFWDHHLTSERQASIVSSPRWIPFEIAPRWFPGRFRGNTELSWRGIELEPPLSLRLIEISSQNMSRSHKSHLPRLVVPRNLFSFATFFQRLEKSSLTKLLPPLRQFRYPLFFYFQFLNTLMLNLFKCKKLVESPFSSSCLITPRPHFLSFCVFILQPSETMYPHLSNSFILKLELIFLIIFS